MACEDADALGVMVYGSGKEDKAAVEKNKEYLMLNLNEVMVLPFEPDPFAVERYEDMLDMEFSVIVP